MKLNESTRIRSAVAAFAGATTGQASEGVSIWLTVSPPAFEDTSGQTESLHSKMQAAKIHKKLMDSNAAAACLNSVRFILSKLYNFSLPGAAYYVLAKFGNNVPAR